MRNSMTVTIRSILAASLLLGALVATPATARDLRVEVNGRLVRLGSRHQCYLDRGVWMIPARPVLEAARIATTWDSRRQELEVWAQYDRMWVAVGSYTVVRSGGRREVLSRPIAIHHGEPYAPVDFLEMCLGIRAWYDRRNEVLTFGRPTDSRWRERDNREWDRWDRRRDYRDGPWDRPGRPSDQRPGLRLDMPSMVYGRHVRIEGEWSGETVRLRLTRADGREAVTRIIPVHDGRWYAELSLSRGEYHVVVEGYAGPFVRQRMERSLSVR